MLLDKEANLLVESTESGRSVFSPDWEGTFCPAVPARPSAGNWVVVAPRSTWTLEKLVMVRRNADGATPLYGTLLPRKLADLPPRVQSELAEKSRQFYATLLQDSVEAENHPTLTIR